MSLGLTVARRKLTPIVSSILVSVKNITLQHRKTGHILAPRHRMVIGIHVCLNAGQNPVKHAVVLQRIKRRKIRELNGE